MPNGSTLSLFATAALILVLIPGPNTLYIIARSVEQGRWAGIVSSLGVQVATLFHIGAATLGLSALLLSSALAFTIVKYLGAAYLFLLGLKALISRDKAGTLEAVKDRRLARAFSQGVVVNLLNPKTGIFFLAFLPQFVDPARGAAGAQIVLLGSIMLILGFMSDSAYVLLAGSVGARMRSNLRFVRGQRYFAGTVYLTLGVVTALTGSGRAR